MVEVCRLLSSAVVNTAHSSFPTAAKPHTGINSTITAPSKLLMANKLNNTLWLGLISL